MHSDIPFSCRKIKGSALLIVLIVLGIAAILLVGALKSNPQVELDKKTADSLAKAKDALIGYAATYRDSHPNEVFGYLPCPDTNNDGVADEPCGTQNVTVIGRLPWKTLGLPPLRDSSGECLWYAVSGTYKNNPKTTVLNWDTIGQLNANDAGGAVLASGLAAVVFSPHGALGNQNRTPAGTTECGGNTTVTAYLDGAGADPIYAGTAPAANAITTLTAATVASVANGTNNDQGLWITPAEIFDRIKRRSDFATDITNMLTDVVSQAAMAIGACTNSTIRATAAGITDPGTLGKSVGLAPDIQQTCIAANAVLRKAVFDNWRNQLLYAVCPGGAACLTVNSNANCAGAAIFSGEKPTGGVRPSSSALNYLEGVNLSAFTATSPTTFIITGAGPYNYQSSSTDIAVCIPPAAANILNFGNVGGNVSNSTAISFTTVTPTSTPQVAVDATTGQVTLGNTLYNDGNTNACRLSGCLWYNNAIPLNIGARIYFSFTLNTIGDGFTFAFIDGDRNTTNNCGQGGEDLGYSGVNMCAIAADPQNFAIYPPVLTWRAGTAYASGTFVKPTAASNRVYMSSASGTSGSSAPTWPTDHSSVSDHGITWWDMGSLPLPNWQSSTLYSSDNKNNYIQANGRVYMANSSGTSGASAPAWPSDYGTVMNGTVTWTDLGFIPPNPVYYPKIGVEFDTYNNSASPSWTIAARKAYYGGRNDADNQHAAIVYWGNSQANTTSGISPSRREDFDDNVHSLSSLKWYDPPNPAPASLNSFRQTARVHHVRIDLIRSDTLYDSHGSYRNYTTNVWVLAENNATYTDNINITVNPCIIGKMQDVSSDFTPNYGRPAAWAPNTIYLTNDCVSYDNNDGWGPRDYVAIAKGTSGTTHPAWPVSAIRQVQWPLAGSTVTDNSVTWQEVGPALWAANKTYNNANDIVFRTNDGSTLHSSLTYYKVRGSSYTGTSGATPPGWSTSSNFSDGSSGLQWRYQNPIFTTDPNDTIVLTDTAKIYDVMGPATSSAPFVDLGEAFKNFRFGFTQGQGGANQNLTINGLKMNMR